MDYLDLAIWTLKGINWSCSEIKQPSYLLFSDSPAWLSQGWAGEKENGVSRIPPGMRLFSTEIEEEVHSPSLELFGTLIPVPCSTKMTAELFQDSEKISTHTYMIMVLDSFKAEELRRFSISISQV